MLGAGAAGKFGALLSVLPACSGGSGVAWFSSAPFFTYNSSAACAYLLALIVIKHDIREESSCSQLLLSRRFETLFEAML